MLRKRILSYSLRKFPHCNVSTLHIKPEVKDAINSGKPVVALESTIISHGMRYPRNLEVALQAEEVIRNCGAIPATCAVIGGFAKVGLEQSDLQLLATQNEKDDTKLHQILKVSRKDLAYACATGKNGATTVSGTMLLAHLSGIKIFATGGIGGVHRGAETTMDISADLQELSKIPVGVVCAGIKSILDIPKTLEYLETLGVPVIGYQCEQFPAFFTKDSGCKSPINANNAMEIARILSVSESLGLPTGAVIAVPPPISTDSNEVSRSKLIQEAIEKAIELSIALNIKGSAITPFLLSEVDKYTRGASLDVNVSLMLNNARIAAEIAIAYNQINYRKPATVHYSLPAISPSSHISSPPSNKSISSDQSNLTNIQEASSSPVSPNPCQATSKLSSPSVGQNIDLPANSLPDTTTITTTALPPQVIVIGGAVVDSIVKSEASIDISLVTGSSAPGRRKAGYGGVARNVADSLRRISQHCNVSLLSVVGQDSAGEAILEDASKKGIDISCTLVSQSKADLTATYTAVHNKDGDLLVAVADMGIMNRVTPASVLDRLHQLINRVIDTATASKQLQQQPPSALLFWPLVVIDANFIESAFRQVVHYCSRYQLTILFEPTSTFKAVAPISNHCLHQLDIVTPNIVELLAMLHACANSKATLSTNILTLLQKYPLDIPPLKITIKEIAVLAVALLRLMLTNNHISNNSEDVNSRARDSNDTRLSDLYLEAVNSFNNNNNIIKQRRIGKHVFVTMGKHGVLWAHQGISSSSSHHPFPSNSSSAKYKTIVVDDDVSWMHLPAISIDPKIHTVGSTNGAGDAFAAGLISELLRQEASNTAVNCNYIQCVESGLKAAHSHLLNDSDKSDGNI